MPLAELHGKISLEARRSEDVLTGAAFGLLTLLPPETSLVPWLRLACREDGASLDLPPIVAAQATFWPSFEAADGGRCEPDVLLTLSTSDGDRVTSGKSGG